MNVVYSEEAERCIARENAAWVQYAERPLLFEEELEEAIEQVRIQPYRTVYASTRRGLVRRILMPKTENHLYYLFERTTQTIEVVSVWGGKKEKGPSFDE